MYLKTVQVCILYIHLCWCIYSMFTSSSVYSLVMDLKINERPACWLSRKLTQWDRFADIWTVNWPSWIKEKAELCQQSLSEVMAWKQPLSRSEKLTVSASSSFVHLNDEACNISNIFLIVNKSHEKTKTFVSQYFLTSRASRLQAHWFLLKTIEKQVKNIYYHFAKKAK